jgi:hypothetical protein
VRPRRFMGAPGRPLNVTVRRHHQMKLIATERASQVLPWLLILYAAASLLHFAHNAEFLAQYPNLPTAWSRADVYVARCCVTTLGIVGYLQRLRGNRSLGLILLALYAVLGFGGLLHYTQAPLAHHSWMMNATIWTEVVVAAVVLANVAIVARQEARPMRPNNRRRGP